MPKEYVAQQDFFGEQVIPSTENQIALLRSERRACLDALNTIEDKLRTLYDRMHMISINREETLHFMITPAGKTMLAFRDGKNNVCVPVTLEEIHRAAYTLQRKLGDRNG